VSYARFGSGAAGIQVSFDDLRGEYARPVGGRPGRPLGRGGVGQPCACLFLDATRAPGTVTFGLTGVDAGVELPAYRYRTRAFSQAMSTSR
jgi:hypothetical protein